MHADTCAEQQLDGLAGVAPVVLFQQLFVALAHKELTIAGKQPLRADKSAGLGK